MRLYLWQHLFVRIGCSIALEAIREVVPESAASLSRLRPVISVDDTLFFAMERVSPTHPSGGLLKQNSR